MTGKIIKGIAGFYYVNDGNNQIFECRAKGIFRNQKIKPLVGDNVTFSILDEKEFQGNIETVLPRMNALKRPAVANVDQAMVLFSLSHPAPNLNLLDRFLIMMKMEEIPVVICFNKMDLAEESLKDQYQSTYQKAGYQVVCISVREQSGIQELKTLLRGKTTVLAGPSGVGKSSLTNWIQPKAAMETGSISRKIERGKHTTRHSELFFVEKDTYMMDTPGFSSMMAPDMEAGALKGCFPEFELWEEGCKFQGCVHVGEKVCGVKEALEQGALSKSRYENYLQIYQELKNKRRY